MTTDETKNHKAIFTMGGTEYRIYVLGRWYTFEDNPRIGAWPISGSEPWKRPHKKFLVAASLWAQQGRRTKKTMLEGVLEAVWDMPSEREWREYVTR